MKAKLLTWWEVLDFWRLSVLGDRGSGRPEEPGQASGHGPSYRSVAEQCRGWLEGVDGFEGVRGDLRLWALEGKRLDDRTILWAVRTLVPAIGKGLAVLPPVAPAPPPAKELAPVGGSLRDRLK